MPAADFDRDFTQAQALYAQGQSAAAGRIWRGLLRIDPQHVGVLDRLSLLLAAANALFDDERPVAELESCLLSLCQS